LLHYSPNYQLPFTNQKIIEYFHIVFTILFGTSFAIRLSRLGPAVTGRLKEYKSSISIINAAWDILKMDFYAQHKP
jgi:hypothetical protein